MCSDESGVYVPDLAKHFDAIALDILVGVWKVRDDFFNTRVIFGYC
ncbi:MAG: hypothetical protein J7L73_09705 [Anaerolineales bacterium]|nr:hypothetical protein [Anaerolineales bacterium]